MTPETIPLSTFIEKATALMTPALEEFGPVATLKARGDCVDLNVRITFGVEARLTTRLRHESNANFVVVAEINAPAMNKSAQEAVVMANIISKLAARGLMVEMAFSNHLVKVKV